MPVTGSFQAFGAVTRGFDIPLGLFTASIAGIGGTEFPKAQFAPAFSEKLILRTKRVFPVIPAEKIVADAGGYGSGSYASS